MQFENEELQILEYLNRKWSALDFDGAPLLLASKLSKQAENFQALEKVHKQLWDLESERRIVMTLNTSVVAAAQGLPLNDKFVHEYYDLVGRNAVKTTELNDERQRIIQEVNQAFGVNEVEKLYSLEAKA